MRRRTAEKVKLFLICGIITVAILSFIFTDRSIRPVIRTLAVTNVNAAVEKIIADTVESEIDTDFENIITFEKDIDGRINAVKTNIITANKLKSRLSVAVLEKIGQITESEVSIPIGSLSGNLFLSGRGPLIPVKTVPIGSVSANLESRFENGGINQTLHRIMLEIKVRMNIILPSEAVETEIAVSVIVSETVIVGTVPEYFSEISIPLG